MKPSKRIVLHVTSSLKMGGAEDVLCTLIEKLGNEEFDHHVIYFHDGVQRERLQAVGVRLYHVSGLLAKYDLVFFYRLYKCIKKIKPNCIHSLLWAANVSARVVGWWLRIPVISVFHNNVDQDGRVRALFDRITLRLASKLVAVSDGVAQSVLKRDAWLPAQAIQIITNGVDADEVRYKGKLYQVSRQSIGLDEAHFVIGFVGRFHEVKHVDHLLESFARVVQIHPHARLVLVGTGDREQFLREHARKLNIEQEVVFVVGKRAYGYYPLFDCFSLTSDEYQSLALLEAMSFGVPAVVTSRNNMHSVIKHEHNGLLVPLGNISEIAVALCGMITDEELRDVLGAQGLRTVVDGFTLQKTVGCYHKLFDDTCVRSRQIRGPSVQ